MKLNNYFGKPERNRSLDQFVLYGSEGIITAIMVRNYFCTFITVRSSER